MSLPQKSNFKMDLSMLLKKTTLAIATTLVCLATFDVASAYTPYSEPPPPAAFIPNDYWYLSGFMGPTITTSNNVVNDGRLKYNRLGYELGFALGYKSGAFRFEGQYTFMRTNHKKLDGIKRSGRTTVHAGMFNTYYDFLTVRECFTPYIGGGVGIGSIRPTNLDPDPPGATVARIDNEFAYQGMIGGLFVIDNEFDLGLSYRYFATMKPTKIFTKTWQNNMINIELIYHFPE
jgi:opacity protein-like surface antigen